MARKVEAFASKDGTPRVPWHQIWRPEVRRWCADLIDQRLRAAPKSEASQTDTHSSETA